MRYPIRSNIEGIKKHTSYVWSFPSHGDSRLFLYEALGIHGMKLSPQIILLSSKGVQFQKEVYFSGRMETSIISLEISRILGVISNSRNNMGKTISHSSIYGEGKPSLQVIKKMRR